MSQIHSVQDLDQTMPGKHFSELERSFLLLQPRIGPQVVQRLEQAGFHSIRQLLATGATLAVLRVSDDRDFATWANRRKALQRALDIWLARAQGALSTSVSADFQN